jgi:predicted CopG family antitoxin
MHVSFMATKTISIDLEAYERLRRARQSPTESFSRVIKRATWSAPERTAGHLVDVLGALPPVDEATLQRLDAAQAADASPEDPWHRP